MKDFRDKVGLTQEELGALLEVGQSAIANYETFYRPPKMTVAKRFIEVARNRGYEYTLEDIYAQREDAVA